MISEMLSIFTSNVTGAIAVAVFEAPWIDLIDNLVLPPVDV